MPIPQPRRSLEEIVQELRAYPIDAFAFVQECVGLASERVHGHLTAPQKQVQDWLMENNLSAEQLPELVQRRELPAQILSALQRASDLEGMNRHITGQQLCEVIRDIALERWGLMARGVLARWNLHRTEDIGAIIFALVENDWLSKQPGDSIEDFSNVFDFEEAFSSYTI